MRCLIACFVSIMVCGTSGCSMFQKAYSYQSNAIKEYHDDWKVVGEEGRGELPRAKETDKLTPFLQSPEARAIEKNLGFD